MNSKFIKLWKMGEKVDKKMTRNVNKELALPKFQPLESSINATVQ